MLTITATDSGFALPARVPAGLTQMRLVNRGTIVHEGILVHFRSPGTAAAYADSYRAGVDFPANAEDIGGPGLARPGDSTSVWLPLEPGHYRLACGDPRVAADAAAARWMRPARGCFVTHEMR